MKMMEQSSAEAWVTIKYVVILSLRSLADVKYRAPAAVFALLIILDLCVYRVQF